ncbi:MAG: hypothetical protein PWQ49_404 [Methanohalophilus sp.]|nr:hypothetical protein [Methanohalophilus sp.]
MNSDLYIKRLFGSGPKITKKKFFQWAVFLGSTSDKYVIVAMLTFEHNDFIVIEIIKTLVLFVGCKIS